MLYRNSLGERANRSIQNMAQVKNNLFAKQDLSFSPFGKPKGADSSAALNAISKAFGLGDIARGNQEQTRQASTNPADAKVSQTAEKSTETAAASADVGGRELANHGSGCQCGQCGGGGRQDEEGNAGSGGGCGCGNC